MINKYNTLFVSLFVHGILLYLLSNVKVPKMKQLETTAIEVYMISIEANSKSESDAIELAHINKPKIIESTETTIRVKTKYFEEQKKNHTNQVNQTISTKSSKKKNTHYKKIDIQKGLKNLLQNQSILYNKDALNQHITTQRTTVSSIRNETVQPMLSIEQKNMQFTTYRRGDYCFKKVSINGGAIEKSDLPTNYLTAPIKCDKTKITKAYDSAMSKWLDSK